MSYGDNTLELHELILSAEDVNNRDPEATIGEYLLEQACKKSNRLGKQGKKVREVTFEKKIDNSYSIIFVCEEWL